MTKAVIKNDKKKNAQKKLVTLKRLLNQGSKNIDCKKFSWHEIHHLSALLYNFTNFFSSPIPPFLPQRLSFYHKECPQILTK